jgi:Asp-tRNA(Asn)/Glu-tRNA(Gln) amidotransferase A subunit family amidase
LRSVIGVAEAVARLSRRELSAEELVRQSLARIAEREPVVQAWEVLDAAGALAEARRIDILRDRPPLCGLPVGVKDLIDTADLPTAYGSPIHRGHRPAQDAECVRRLRDAGAVVLGKTVTTEFALYSPGKTRNPRDPTRTPGGSSSGSAAAVADGMVPVALGSQTAGSVIRPASYCGVVGFKPTHGVLPLQGIHPLAPSLDTLGFFVREIEDVPLILSVLSGAPPVRIRNTKPRLGLCRTEAWPRAAPETQNAVEKAASSLGVREVELGPAFSGLIDAQIAIMGAEASHALGDKPENQLSPKLREFLREGAKVTPERLRAARDHADRCRRELGKIFASVDALLTPAAPGEAPEGLGATGDPIFCRLWTLLGTPCISLPVLTGTAGLPIGLQIVGAPNREADLLSAAWWIQRSFRERQPPRTGDLPRLPE